MSDSVEDDCWESDAELFWRSWGAESVVYESGSGDTHLLDLLSAVVLKFLEIQKANTSELASQVADSLETKCDKAFLEQIQQVLSNLHIRGLIGLVVK